MHIAFTKQEYQTLVEMLLVADLVIRGDEEAPRAETAPYAALRKKVLSHFREMGLAEDFYYDPARDDYFETSAYEARASHLRFVDEHDDTVFWSQLAAKLAARDMAAEQLKRGEQALSDEARFGRLLEITERYARELEAHGLDNLRLVADASAP